MTTGKVTTLIVITLIWWAFGPGNNGPLPTDVPLSEHVAKTEH